MPECWPPSRYTVLRVGAGGHRAQLMGDEDDDFRDDEERAWREHWRPALLMSRAYAEVGPDGDALVVSFVVWDRTAPA